MPGAVRLRTRLLVVLGLVALLSSLVTAGAGYVAARDALDREATQAVDTMAALQASEIARLLGHKRDQAELLAARPDVSGALGRVVAAHAAAQAGDGSPGEGPAAGFEQDPEVQRVLEEVLATTPLSDIRALLLVDLDGAVLATTAGASRDASQVLVDPLRSNVGGLVPSGGALPHVLVASPVAVGDAIGGFLVVEADTSDIADVLADTRRLGDTAEATLARRLGTGETQYLLPTRFEGHGALAVLPAAAARAMQRTLDGEQGVLPRAQDYRGERVIASGRLLEEGWGLVVKIDIVEAQAPAAALAARFAGVAALTVALGGVAAVVLASALSRPLQRLAGAADRIRSEGRAEAVEVGGSSEVQALARSFNELTASLLAANSRMEEEVRRKTAELRSVVDTAAEAIITADGNGRIVSANPSAQRVFGHPAADLVGQPLTALMPERFRPLHESGLARFRATRTPHVVGNTVELVGLHRDGHEFPIELSLSHWQLGGSDFFTGIVRDVSRRKQAEHDLREAKEAAEAATRSKSAFLANMSHEIRTPLNAVIGMASLLEDSRLDSGQRELLATLQQSGDHLLHVINDILDYSKIESGKLDLEQVDLHVADLVESAFDQVVLRAAAKGLDLTHHIAPDVPPAVEGDPNRLRQVLLNLLSNAVKFTPQGHVHLEVRVERGSELVFELSDTGIGIAPEQAGRLFASFSQGDASTTRRFGGTGLGLAISKRLVEAMGGTIGLSSVLGHGSVFTVRIPLRAAAMVPPPTRAAQLGGRVAVVVADGERHRAMLVDALRALGLGAYGFTPALEPAPGPDGALQPDLAIVDVAQGEEACAERVRQAWPRARVLFTAPPGVAPMADPPSVQLPVKRSQLLNAVLTAFGSARDAPREAQPAGQAPLRILVCEDNPVNQQVALKLLSSLGHRADVAPDGAEGVAKTRQGQYDVVLMDVQMPVMDGLEAARAIRALALPRQPRIIAMTAEALPGDREKCLEAGMDDYVSKPVRRDALARALAAVPRPASPAPASAGTPAQEGSPQGAGPSQQAGSPQEPGSPQPAGTAPSGTEGTD